MKDCSLCNGEGEIFLEGTAWWRTLIDCYKCNLPTFEDIEKEELLRNE